MKSRFKFYILIMILGTVLIQSCSEDFLEVSDPTVLSEAIFPASVSDMETVMIDIYGRLQDGFYSDYFRAALLLSHNVDHGYNGAEFNELAMNILTPSMRIAGAYWDEQYLAIGKCNLFFKTLEEFRSKEGLSAGDLDKLSLMEGQVKFLRAFNYFHLINTYGETPILTEADKGKMGIPLWTAAPSSINETAIARATQGEVWDQIITDLQSAVTLLAGYDEVPRISEWAAKALLAKSYIFTLQYSQAVPLLKDVIDNSGRSLVSYDVYKEMFHGNDEFNNEIIFDVNFAPDNTERTEGTNVGNQFPRYISVTRIEDGSEKTNGYGNLFIHDKNIPRFGFDGATPENQQDPEFLAWSQQVRDEVLADPRLYCSTFQPYFDHINYEGQDYLVGKSRLESYNATNSLAWNNKKYTLVDVYWKNPRMSKMNHNVLRMGEVYLLYAEALIKSGDNVNGLEWLNKVHRRAYNQPINSPSQYDYTSLTDRTKAVKESDPLANSPLMYERWAEMFGEGKWWYDVRRWDLGQEEALYFEKVQHGPLSWADTKYAMPIPTGEINSNSSVVQNPGY